MSCLTGPSPGKANVSHSLELCLCVWLWQRGRGRSKGGTHQLKPEPGGQSRFLGAGMAVVGVDVTIFTS